MKHKLGFALTLASTLALAQQGGIGAVQLAPNPVRAGQEVKITVSAEGEAPTFCGLVVHFDDGSESRQVKIDGKQNKFPVTISKTYANAGTYNVTADGRKITSHLPCTGKATTKLVVEAAPAAPAAAKPAAAKPAAATAVCPEGYKLSGKMGKAGDYSCKGGKGAAAPAKPLSCGEGLEAFANDKSKQLGCRKLKAKTQ